MAMELSPDVSAKLALRENLIRLQTIRAQTRRDNDSAVIQEHQIAIESQMPYGIYARSYDETEQLMMLARRGSMANDESESPCDLGEWLDREEQD
jgi:hypothetical protein